MTLNALKRDVVGKQVKKLRGGDLTPASLYGSSRNPSISLSVKIKELREVYKACGHSKIFDVQVEGEAKPVKAVFKEIQVDPLKGLVIHASLHQIEMDKKITAEIPLIFSGVSLAVKNNLGLLVTSLSSINVSCLPADLPSQIEIDISSLNDVGDTILLDRIKLPNGVEVGHGTSKDAVIAYISAPQKIEVEATPTETTDAAAAAPGEEGEAKAEGEADATGKKDAGKKDAGKKEEKKPAKK
jgi:large subunit ribosomal protein L25